MKKSTLFILSSLLFFTLIFVNKDNVINEQKSLSITTKKTLPQQNIKKSTNTHQTCNSTKTPTKLQISNEEYIGQNNIKLFFINFNQTKPNSDCSALACKSLLREINNTKQSIDFAIYGINNEPQVFNALTQAKNRGVKIRWVTDAPKNNINYYPDTKKLMKFIKNYKTDSSKEYEYTSSKDSRAIMHNKFFIFDKKRIWTGSANITNTDLSNFNSNYSVLINSPQIAQIYTQEFEKMYSGKFHNLKQKTPPQTIKINDKTSIKILFSPQDKIIKNEISEHINNAKKYIYIPIFYFTRKDLAQNLIQAKKRGVEIKIITDATNARGKYSIHKLLRKNGIKVKTENKAGKMHMKAIIIDDKYSILGSMNLTKSGEKYNDENILVINSIELTKYLKNTFLLMWNSIPDKYLEYDPGAESKESIGSCTDGIDNDFDKYIDSKDYSCKY